MKSFVRNPLSASLAVIIALGSVSQEALAGPSKFSKLPKNVKFAGQSWNNLHSAPRLPQNPAPAMKRLPGTTAKVIPLPALQTLPQAVLPASPPAGVVGNRQFVGRNFINVAAITNQGIRTPILGIPDLRTGRDLSNGNPGSGLPGVPSTGFPSGAQQWNDRINGFLSGGNGDLGTGMPFGSNPWSDPVGDFFNQHGSNIPDPLAASGKSGLGLSPADEGSDENSTDGASKESSNDTGKGSVTVPSDEIWVVPGTMSVVCGSDVSPPSDFAPGGTDGCAVIQYNDDGSFKSDADRQIAIDYINTWYSKGNGKDNGNGNKEPVDDGQGGCGGDGLRVGDLNGGSAAQMTGKVVGGHNTDGPGLGQDTGHKMPGPIDAIGKYIARGGKVIGKAGYQGSDSGHGQDIGGAAADKVSAVQKAIEAHQFDVNPNAAPEDQIPWWIQAVVSPKTATTTKAKAN